MAYKSQTVSAIVITHNDAATLENTLYTLHWVDELIVLDRGSTDNTLNIARTFTDKVFFHPSDNLTILRRDALTLGKSDWLFLIEPYEWVEEMLKHEIDGVMLNMQPNVNGFTVSRKLKFQNEWVDVISDVEPPRALRLVRKGRWKVSDNWHATLSVDGDVKNLRKKQRRAGVYTEINDSGDLMVGAFKKKGPPQACEWGRSSTLTKKMRFTA